MKKRIFILGLILSISLVGCGNTQDLFKDYEKIREEAKAKEETETASETLAEEENTEDEKRKMEILTYINSRVDPLFDTNMSDEEIEAQTDKIWIEAENKFGITENDIINIMADTSLTKEYYSSVAKENEIKTYDATLEDNGYGTVFIAVSEDALDKYLDAISNKDEATKNNLFQAGQVAYETNGTKVDIVDFGIAVCKVKLLEGINKDATVYVISEHVKMKE